MGFTLVIGFIEHFQLVTLLHSLEIIIAHAEPQFVVVFTSRCSVTVLNNGDSSPLMPTSLSVGYHLTIQSQSQIYFTAGGLLPISSSWRQAP
jgi:hypothetical protein